MFKKDWATFSYFMNYFTLNIEHIWKDMCIWLR